MTMGEVPRCEQCLQGEQDMQDCVRRSRRNALGNIFEGVEETVLQRLAGLSLDMVQQLVMDSGHDTATPCLPDACPNSQELPSSSSSSCSSSSSSFSSDSACCCERARLQRSFSTTDGEEVQAALSLQNRHRRNAVGNLFDLLTLSQKLLLVEHLQEQLERLPGLQNDDNNGQAVCSLADLSSSSSQSSGSSSTVSSPRSQGEIVCR